MACNIICTDAGWFCAVANAIFCNGTTLIISLILFSALGWLYVQMKNGKISPRMRA